MINYNKKLKQTEQTYHGMFFSNVHVKYVINSITNKQKSNCKSNMTIIWIHMC